MIYGVNLLFVKIKIFDTIYNCIRETLIFLGFHF
jgi:hypothetical protein